MAPVKTPDTSGPAGPRLTRRSLLIGTMGGVLALTGCNEKSDDTSSRQPASGKDTPNTADGGPMRVALVMKTLTNPFFIAMEAGARKAATEHGVELLVRTAAEETSIEQQITIVGDMIDQGVDALVIAPGDSVQILPALKAAADRGIILVNIDNRLDPTFAQRLGLGDIPFISVDNERGAHDAALFLAGATSGPAKAAIIEGIRTAANAEARFQGASRAFGEIPGLELVVHESANWKIDEGYNVTAQMMRDHPDLALIYCANDMMALGAIRRLAELGRPDVMVGGFDALTEAITAIQEGRMRVTVDQDAARQGYLGVDYAVRRHKGENVPSETLVPARLITANDFPPAAR
ncbi:substrate-binding domain-containing protein [Segnochrobactraceae bacterium EtOH-i3]